MNTTTDDGARISPRVVLYGRVGCHLCDDARDIVTQVCDLAGVTWSEVDVDDEPRLARQYGDLVPVVTVDGVQQGFWRVDALRLARAVAAGGPRAAQQ